MIGPFGSGKSSVIAELAEILEDRPIAEVAQEILQRTGWG
ncbi:MAG: ATP/GTP-binding protein [Actinobacteria bacterium]|nr:ATP/GTP-binding protein [Actinomycetota bacterium]MCI0544428.1 ATP/GTP-binding protein [Actinomycetota bacterium]